MRLLTQTLCLCLGLALSRAAPSHHYVLMAADDHHADHHGGHHDDQEAHHDDHKPLHHHNETHHDHNETHHEHSAQLDRCDGIEFDAITPDKDGVIYFFKGDHLWKGFHGHAELSNGTFKELDEHHQLGHVDAAFRQYHDGETGHHEHVYFLLGDQVFSYRNHTLEAGYPNNIQDVFPGIPSHLDAAVECPTGECNSDSVIFFKGDKVYQYDFRTKTSKQKDWSHLPNCTSALRWLEHYYCFHGHNFTRFHPVTGEVVGTYPKDARKYFMKCDNFSHGEHDHAGCQFDHLDAIAIDAQGKSYAFMGTFYIRLDAINEGSHHFPITRNWKELDGNLDAAFNYNMRLYFVKGDQVYVYTSKAHYTLVEGYPKPLKEELGIEGHVDAAFVCKDDHIVYVIQGHNMSFVDLSATPRAVIKELPIPYLKVDAAMCGPKGVTVYVGKVYFEYATPLILATSKISPPPRNISDEILGCIH